MTLRIPSTPDATLRTWFEEIERRLRKLEQKTGITSSGTTVVQVIGGGGGSVNLNPIMLRLEALEAALANLPEPEEIPLLGGVGSTSNAGIAPEPGTALPPTGTGQHLLTENATWGFPLRGLVSVATAGDETSASNLVNVDVGESYNGYQVPGEVWDFYPADAFHWDSSLRTLEEYDFDFMPARYVDTRVLGHCRATVSWDGSLYSGDCTYDFVETGTVDTVGVWGFGPAGTGTVEGDMMTLVFAMYSIP